MTSYIAINSGDRTTGTDADFIWKCDLKLWDVVSILIDWIQITNSFNNVDSSNNTFKFTDSTSASFTATVAAGVYTAFSFAAALQTAIVATGTTDAITVAFNPTTQRIVITDATGAFTINAGTTMTRQLGIKTLPVSSVAGVFAGVNVTNMNRTQVLYLTSGKLSSFTDEFTSAGGPNQQLPPSGIPNNPVNNVITTIPVAQFTNTSTFLFMPPDRKVKLNWQPYMSFEEIDLHLYFDDGTLVDLQGVPWTIFLQLSRDSTADKNGTKPIPATIDNTVYDVEDREEEIKYQEKPEKVKKGKGKRKSKAEQNEDVVSYRDLNR